METPKRNVNYMEMHSPAIGKERQMDFVREALDNGTFLPKTVVYEDIDSAFKEWVENELKIQNEGKNFPTMVMYSNQRFTEYTQTWQYTDANKNLILNFKTITRENNPEYGHIQGGLWNIPGDRFYIMKRQIVLDDNGSESFVDLRMKQPLAIDLMYKMSIFTTNIQSINEFNMMVNDKFRARQAYIQPNGYYMPMVLDGISDKSSYELSDRQFYSQAYTIKVMAYIIREGDFRIEERPLKRGLHFNGGFLSRRKASVEIEEFNPCWDPVEERYKHREVDIVIDFPKCVRNVEFDIDMNLTVEGTANKNLSNDYKIWVDGELMHGFPFKIKDGSTVKIKAFQCNGDEPATMRLLCYDDDEVYDTQANPDEKPLTPEQEPLEYVIET